MHTGIQGERLLSAPKGWPFGKMKENIMQYYVWIDGDSQDKFTNLGEAQHWMQNNIATGSECYIVDSDNNIVDQGNANFWQP